MLNLKEDPSANHVKEMAAYFNAELDEGNDASTISMDNGQAIGFISSYRVFSGLSVWVYNIRFRENFRVDLSMTEDSPYYFSYNVEGHFFHRFNEDDNHIKVLQNQNMIVIGGSEALAEIIFPKDVNLKIAVIVVDVKLLETQNIRNAKRIHTKIQKIFKEVLTDRPFRHLGKIRSETKKFASIVCENNDVDLVGGLLTEGAVLNMFASQLNSYVEEIDDNGQPSRLSASELSKITNLGSYIIDHIETNFTIQELSTTFGISPKKLQTGVKHLYGETVANYVLNLRMGHAKHLLITTDSNVSEVCNLIGISSKSYFSKIFKERYGISPRAFKHS